LFQVRDPFLTMHFHRINVQCGNGRAGPSARWFAKTDAEQRPASSVHMVPDVCPNRCAGEEARTAIEVLSLNRLSTRTRNRLDLMQAYIARRTHLPGGPLILTIESTAKCNLSCPMCLRQRVYFPARDMEFSVFRKIIDEGKDFLEFAVPYGAGEPLLNPEIFDMIAYCTKLDIPTGISTNATVLSEESSRRLIEAGLDSITLAFDSSRREVFETYRNGADFDRVRNNILTFLRVKKAMKSRIFCIVQMVALKENRKDVRELIRMWKLEGIDGVRIKKDEVHNEGSAIPGDNSTRPPRRYPCYQLWRGPMYIHYDGTTFPCCYTYPEEAVGNIKRNTLEQIWNSEKIVRMREAHVRGDLRDYPVCRNCPAARPRLAITLGSFLINTHTAMKAVPFFERMAQILKIPIFETLK
jgi:radical SAM protein with 4Fe4S-binding SPASM domain